MSVRVALGIKDGDVVVFRVEDNRVTMTRFPGFLDLAGTVNVAAMKRNATWDEVLSRTRSERSKRSRL